MTTLASDWPGYFRLSLLNCWTEFKGSWKEAKWIQRNLTESKISISSTTCVCFRADQKKKNKIAILAFDSLTHFRFPFWNRWTEFNETRKESRSQRPLPSTNASVFRADRKNKMATLASDFPMHFRLSGTAELNSTKLDRKQDFNVCRFRSDLKNKIATQASDGLGIFDFASETTERNSTTLDRMQDFYILYQVCVFRVDRKNKMAVLSDLSIKVAHCSQVHDMWPSGIRKPWLPWPLIHWDILASPLQPLNGIRQLLTER